ncbi:glycogen synthase GlgA [Pectinatus sottacetonis]|uniref:glycogen synthase GlgA n=1 Tax=Pectinatus sottacetonis TaxID=1002795 RepID=UPI0018C696A2|nr:glycogen synthase GlgA [Pectinatus sottacetonis]
MLKLLYVASEASPFVKTGGLGDVAGSLPKELKKQNIDVRVVIPKYSTIAEQYRSNMKNIYSGSLKIAWREKYFGIETLKHNNVTFYFIDNEDYFKRDGYYGYDDDDERFTFFCRAVLSMLPIIDFWPDIINLNDWQTGLVSVFLKLNYMHKEKYQNIKTVYTIHNLKYQGIFPKRILTDVLGLDNKYFDNGDLEFYNNINFMKGGIIYSDALTTVSHSYASEIQNPYFGEQLDGILKMRSKDLTGILNGIDYTEYNPETDPHIFFQYTIANAIEKKIENKVALQQKLGLPINRKIPVIAFISRLVEAKGIDLLIRILDELLQYEDIQFVLLGTGDYKYEEWFRSLQWRFPKKVSVNTSFDENLAHQIYAASSLFIMPSRYEPCGIGQMIALRYGSVPIVHAVGGLRDTVFPYDSYTNSGNGFVFNNYNAHELLFSIKRALEKSNDIILRRRIIENAMSSDYSWTGSAKQYKMIYEDLAKKYLD